MSPSWRSRCARPASARSTLATVSGSVATSVLTGMARSAPDCQCSARRFLSLRRADGTATTVSLPASMGRTSSSWTISSNGFIDVLALAVSTPLPCSLVRTLTLRNRPRA